MTKAKHDRLATAEFEVIGPGFTQFRIRSHENLARLEFIQSEMDKSLGKREKLAEICQRPGFNFIAIDMNGYRTSAMNKVLSDSEKRIYYQSDAE